MFIKKLFVTSVAHGIPCAWAYSWQPASTTSEKVKNKKQKKSRKPDRQWNRGDLWKSLKKNKIKGVHKKELTDTFEHNTNTVAEELVSSENIVAS